MAYVKLNPIKSEERLIKSIAYIINSEKTEKGNFVDSFQCIPSIAADQFAFVRNKKVMKKGNNFAWHIKQSFSPADNVTPEQALEIGKELMSRMYPNYQYVIAVHTDKAHLHTHIICNAVDFVTFHKLNSNFKTYSELQTISDDICREYNLSVIDKGEPAKSHRQRLKENIDKAIENATDFQEFIALMQEQGYLVRIGNKAVSFKDRQMKTFLRSSSISVDYTEAMLKYRINNKEKILKQGRHISSNRKIYDDKILFRSKRKLLQTEIDAYVNKANSFDEFTSDMQKKNFEVKRGKYLTFKNPKTAVDSDKQSRFIRSGSMGYEYSEEALRFRIEHKEEYKSISEAKVKSVMNIGKSDNANLKSWKNAQNVSIRTATTLWVVKNILAENYGISIKDYAESKVKFNEAELFGAFLESYKTQKEIIEKRAAEVEAVNTEISEISKYKKAVSTYWKLKPTIEKYKAENTDIHNLSGAELKAYKSNTQKWEYALKVMNEAKEKYSLSTSELNSRLNELTAQKAELQQDMVRLKLQFENYEIIKSKYLSKDGYGFLFDTPKRFTEIAQTAWKFRKKSILPSNRSTADKVFTF
ncbi:MAG: relaxase/mobilization nuclease domain-containing protein [Eubacterium sp.]|nr:relaxase/mobilization nuclease domain-containing protein [Eubacterium sp.]